MFHIITSNMFHMPLPILEKILRPMVVYLFLVVFLRIFGKRELAQLNPFDLVVLLSLSNTVQNAMIGDDNSVSGGVIGAFSLLAINWLLTRVLYKAPKLTEALEGEETMLIRHGIINHKALAKEILTEPELLSVLHKQGFADFGEVEKCVLEPNGNFYIEGRKPSSSDTQHGELLKKLDALAHELKQIKSQLASQ